MGVLPKLGAAHPTPASRVTEHLVSLRETNIDPLTGAECLQLTITAMKVMRPKGQVSSLHYWSGKHGSNHPSAARGGATINCGGRRTGYPDILEDFRKRRHGRVWGRMLGHHPFLQAVLRNAERSACLVVQLYVPFIRQRLIGVKGPAHQVPRVDRSLGRQSHRIASIGGKSVRPFFVT